VEPASALAADGPILSVDMDGVLAAPPLGLPNLSISRRLITAPVPDAVVPRGKELSALQRRAAAWLQRLRYGSRALLPGVADGLAAIARHRELVLVTGRSWHGRETIEDWLERHGLRGYFTEVHCNDTGLASAPFKLYTARRLRAVEHVDDDGAVAHYLASNGLARVYLRRWARNRGLPYPPNVVEVSSLLELAEHLQTTAAASPAAPGERDAR
jgi:hypothetical protein